MGQKQSKKGKKGSPKKGTMKWEWVQLGTAPWCKRFDHTVVKESENVFWLFGGMGEGWAIQNDLWQLTLTDDKKMEWKEFKPKEGAPTPPPVKDHSAVFDPDRRRIYVFGGKTTGKHSLNQLWCFDLEKSEWSLETEEKEGVEYPCKRYGHSAVMYKGAMCIFGGKRHGKDKQGLDDFWKYDPDNKTWEAVKPASEKKPSGVIYHSAVVHDTEMIVCCGFTEKKPINDVWSYDFGISGDLMVIALGEGYKEEDVTSESDTWIFDSAKGDWSKVDEGPAARLGHKGEATPHGWIICGGIRVTKGWEVQEWYNDVWILQSK